CPATAGRVGGGGGLAQGGVMGLGFSEGNPPPPRACCPPPAGFGRGLTGEWLGRPLRRALNERRWVVVVGFNSGPVHFPHGDNQGIQAPTAHHPVRLIAAGPGIGIRRLRNWPCDSGASRRERKPKPSPDRIVRQTSPPVVVRCIAAPDSHFHPVKGI